MNWIIFYSDGTTFSSNQGTWEEAPSIDVQVILYHDIEAGWIMRHGGDFFRLDWDGSVVAMDHVGMRDYVVNMMGMVKEGRMLTPRGWDKVYQQAKSYLRHLKDGSTIS